jgi:predicted ABC-type transport system involved in lysophospholipase L1 biosynthesis ATPase subunit
MNPTPPAIELRQLTKRLPSGDRILTILDAVDLTIAAGEFVAVLGPSGSGKSTLLGLAAGLDRPTSGEVLIDGAPIQNLSEDALALLRRRKIGFVFQSFQLLGNMTALENVLLPLELGGHERPLERARQLLLRVAWANAGITIRPSSRAASSSVSRWRVPSRRGRRSCSPTSPPAISTAPPARGSSTSSTSCAPLSRRPSFW